MDTAKAFDITGDVRAAKRTLLRALSYLEAAIEQKHRVKALGQLVLAQSDVQAALANVNLALTTLGYSHIL